MKFKSVFLSDTHLGTKGCSHNELLYVINNIETDNLYLVGDIIDMWQLKKKWYWPKPHNDIIQKLLRKSRKGTNVTYIPGNHDEHIRTFAPLLLGDIKVEYEVDYHTINGEKFLVTHGDLYDVITRYHTWIAKLGDVGYTFLIEINRYLNSIRNKLGMKYWSLSQYVKTKVKNAASFISNYEEQLAKHCKHHGYDGIICGHIHVPNMINLDGIKYFNDGDMVETKTILVETFDGDFVIYSFNSGNMYEIMRWDSNQHDPIIHDQPILQGLI